MNRLLPIVLFLSLAPLATAASDPGSAAMEFFGKAREKKVDLAPGADTAITSLTLEDRRKSISGTYQRLAAELATGTLELGPVQQKGDLAAVIIRKVDEFDRHSMNVFAVALIHRAGRWLPAPVPGSFENSGLVYQTTTADTTALEDWMLRQRTLELIKLRQEATVRLRSKIEASLPRARLAAMSPREIGLAFADACQRRDLPAMLGFLGGLNQTLPDDWDTRLKRAGEMIAPGKDPLKPWPLLLSPDVFRLLAHIEQEDDEAIISYACLDPGQKPPVFQILHIDLVKSDDDQPLWQIDLPPAFYDENDDLPEDEDLDNKILASLPEKISKSAPATPAATPQSAWENLQVALRAPTLSALLPTLAPAPDKALQQITKSALLWQALHDSTTVTQLLPLAFHTEPTAAAAIVQCFSTRDPERTDLRLILFQKTPAGWFWNPTPPLDAAADSEIGKINHWFDTQRPTLGTTWQHTLLSQSIPLQTIPENNAPTSEAARQLIQNWLAATRTGDVAKALALTAWIDDGRGATRLLRNLGYDMAAARKTAASSEILEIQHSPHWAAAGLRTTSAASPPLYPFYPIILTEKGPRILLEIDLFATTTRGREFLNKASLDRLLTATTPTLTNDLGTLLENFKKTSNIEKKNE